jgi:hypothetical protein
MSDDSEQTSGVHIDYGHEPSRWQRFTAAIRHYFDTYWEDVGFTVGALADLAGGTRQLLFAFGLAFLAGGFAIAIERDSSSAPFWMWLGGFLLGLAIPLPKSNKEKL